VHKPSFIPGCGYIFSVSNGAMYLCCNNYISYHYGFCCQSWCGHATWKLAWSWYRDQITVNRSALEHAAFAV